MKEVECVAVDSVSNPRGKITSLLLGSIVLPNNSRLTNQRNQAVGYYMLQLEQWRTFS